MLDFGILVIWLAFSYDVKISPTKWENYVGYCPCICSESEASPTNHLSHKSVCRF